MVDETNLEAEIERFRAAQGMGRTGPQTRLFDYLAGQALKGAATTETDIAIEVFGKIGTDPGDASVRVNIHRLRRKLEEFYSGPGKAGEHRLIIPRGEYRIALADREQLEPLDTLKARRRWPWIGAAILAVLFMGAVLGAIADRWAAPRDSLTELARAPIWSDMAADPRPILVVVGDYYIFGEAERGEVRRLVREFEVNSRLELESWLLTHPDKVGRYVDLDLNYAPIGATVALSDILPIAHHIARDGAVHMVTASELTPDMLRANHIIYVGFLSGLGPLENTVFTRSRFGIGLSYDEILDYNTRRLYISQAGRPTANQMHHDFGYISSFLGPGGGRILVLAGTRDVGVMQTAEAASDPEALRTLAHAAGGGPSLEGVYEVEGLGRQNLMGTLILSDQRPDLDKELPQP